MELLASLLGLAVIGFLVYQALQYYQMPEKAPTKIRVTPQSSGGGTVDGWPVDHSTPLTALKAAATAPTAAPKKAVQKAPVKKAAPAKAPKKAAKKAAPRKGPSR